MKTGFWVLLGMALAVTPMFAQTAAQSAPPSVPATVAAIPPDQQATKDQMNRLFEVMRLHDELQATMKAIPTMIQQQLSTQMNDIYSKLPADAQPTEEQTTKLHELLSKYLDRAATLYSPDDMMADIMGIYQRHLTRTDVDAYIAFYNSPAGQHLLDAQPVIMQEYMPLVMQRVQTATKELTDEMNKDAQTIVKRPAAPANAPAAK
jgi:hypothetical protein